MVILPRRVGRLPLCRPALFAGGAAIAQPRPFIVAPLPRAAGPCSVIHAVDPAVQKRAGEAHATLPGQHEPRVTHAEKATATGNPQERATGRP